jgi:hypothetical protein
VCIGIASCLQQMFILKVAQFTKIYLYLHERTGFKASSWELKSHGLLYRKSRKQAPNGTLKQENN